MPFVKLPLVSNIVLRGVIVWGGVGVVVFLEELLRPEATSRQMRLVETSAP